MAVILWTVWTLLVDKKRIRTILLVGLITSLLAIMMDDIGISLSLWAYPYQIVYFMNRLKTVDVSIIPVFYMLLYQYFRTWKSFMIALVLLCLFAVFVAEPIFGKLGMYERIQWEYWYSGPIYLLMGVFVKGLVDKIDKRYP